MLILGIKEEIQSVGTYDIDMHSVGTQRIDIIKIGNSFNELSDYYNESIKKGEKSKKKLSDLQDELEFSSMSEEEYDKLYDKYAKDIQILSYNRVIIVDGISLK